MGYEEVAGDRDAAIWTSDDGRSWVSAPNIEEVFGGDREQEIFAVTAVGGLLIAAGHDASDGTKDAAIWTSLDGEMWERQPSDELEGSGEQSIKALVVVGSRLIALGRDDFDIDEDAGAWYSIIPDEFAA